MRDPSGGWPTRLVITLAGVLVPREQRARWRREWEAESAAARERGRGSLPFALGALPDAWALRRIVRKAAAARSRTKRRSAMMSETAGVGAALRDGLREVRRALRSLARVPGFTAASVLALAVGIGATATLVTLVDAILLRPLPYPAAERVVRVHHTFKDNGGANPLARFAFAFIAEESRSFEAIGAYWSPGRYTLAGDDVAERVQGARATPGLLSVLGARPLAGRMFGEADAAEEEASGVLLSHRLWQRRYGGDREVVGRTIVVDGRPREVLGVVAPGADLPLDKVDLWVPYAVPPGIPADDAFRLHVLARLRPAVDLATAEAEMQALTARFPELGPFYRTYLDDFGLRTEVRSVREEVVGPVERPLWILMGAVLIVLIMAAANVATLFLVRAEGRRQEVAIRAALGARPAGLIGHFLSESLVVAAAAGAAGLLAAAGAVRLFRSLAPPGVPRLDEIAIRWPTGAVVLALSGVIALVLGVYPFLRFGQGGFATLRGRAAGESLGQRTIGGGLVIAQVALALVLLSGSVLLLRTFQALRAVDPGFEPAGVLVADFSLPAPFYPDAERVRQFQQRLLEEVRGLPGVQGAALGPSPLGHGGCNGMYVQGMVLPEGQFPPCIPVVFVSPGYWEILGIRRVAGRTFEEADLHPSS
ncbi:MAG: ABC transporter permease, partial [Gemmatimonadetes bacterium]|nr:ABC transporter permease [Gemmatimonadota bacterium]